MKPGRRFRWKRVVGIALFLLIAAAAAAGFLRFRQVSAHTNLPTAPARKGDFLVISRARGELKARRSMQITAPVNVPELRIVWLAPASTQVKEGEAIIRFDPSSAKQQLQERVATLKQAQASLDQAVAEARITAEQDTRDLSNSQYQVERASLEASKAEIVSALQAEESRIDLASAQKRLAVQQATVALHEASARARIASLTRQRDQAQAEVDLTNHRLAQMEVKSPLNGLIIYLPNFSQGWMNAKPFKVGDQVWPGAALAEIPDLKTLEMEGKIEEIERGRVTAGADVRVRIDSLPELTLNAKLKAISPLTQLSFEWPPTSSFRGYAPLDNPDPRLQPGMNGSMDVVVNRIPGAISIPAKALFTHSGKPLVWLPTNKGYVSREVKVLARNPDEVAVSGLEEGAKVALVEPQMKERKP